MSELADAPLVLVCDDEELIRWSLCEHLTNVGFRTVAAENGQQALDILETTGIDAAIFDLKMPVMDGLTALRRLREQGLDVPVVMITAHGAVESAIEATRLGAAAYLPKPFDLREVELAVRKVLDDAKLRHEVAFHRGRQTRGYHEFVGESPALNEVFATLRRLETVDPPTVLISGESGTGKDVLARAIHARGLRKTKPFVDIDCASLPEALIESELFGHERGAFTDARTMKRGLFETAAGGVLFLDEIGEMPLATQVKLLRALESRRFKRVGGVTAIELTATVIAATNRDLREEVRAGRFREDLFFRLAIIPVRIPPLRERREDIPAFVGFFLEKFTRVFGRDVVATAPALALLRDYAWPGNVRELRNVMERLVILGGAEIRAEDLPAEIRFGSKPSPTADTALWSLPEEGLDLAALERSLIEQAIHRTEGNQSAAARLLGLTRFALRYRIEKFQLGIEK